MFGNATEMSDVRTNSLAQKLREKPTNTEEYSKNRPTKQQQFVLLNIVADVNNNNNITLHENIYK